MSSYPTVRADGPFTASWNYQAIPLVKDEIVRGEFARHLLDTGAPVTDITPSGADDAPKAPTAEDLAAEQAAADKAAADQAAADQAAADQAAADQAAAEKAAADKAAVKTPTPGPKGAS